MHLDVWPRTVAPGGAVRVVLVNGSNASVPVCDTNTVVWKGEARVPGSAVSHAPCRTEAVFREFSHEWSMTMPTAPGVYRLQLGDAATTVEVSSKTVPVSDPGSTHTITMMGASTLTNLHRIQPTDVVTLGGNRLAIRGTVRATSPRRESTCVTTRSRARCATSPCMSI